jgi:hypothetical protein
MFRQWRTDASVSLKQLGKRAMEMFPERTASIDPVNSSGLYFGKHIADAPVLVDGVPFVVARTVEYLKKHCAAPILLDASDLVAVP